MGTRWFALVVGVVYLVIGIAGFIPALGVDRHTPDLAIESHYRDLFGLFPINILHNVVHLSVGVLGIVAYRSFASARLYCKGLAIFYGVLAIMGMIPVLNTTFDLIPIFSHDIWLHALTALAAAYSGWAVSEDDTGEPLRSDPPGTVR
ncbi:MAG TPA: DUF4383 domain-containing protein [Thermomicrobiales bacterium]|nr:DUF4383 domain-containing protein [Thermomicrobiales bacterium]